jgi:hypothetical protein
MKFQCIDAFIIATKNAFSTIKVDCEDFFPSLNSHYFFAFFDWVSYHIKLVRRVGVEPTRIVRLRVCCPSTVAFDAIKLEPVVGIEPTPFVYETIGLPLTPNRRLKLG